MKVGLAIETDSPGGAETMLLELARELRERGHEVTAFGPTGGWLTERLRGMGIERVRVDFEGFYGLGSVPQIASALRELRLDVLHSHDFGMAVTGGLGCRLAGCRHIITMHGGAYYSLKLRRRMALRLAMSLSSRTVAVSGALRSTLADSLGVSADTIDVIHNGVAPAAGDGAGARAELGLGPSDVLVLAVGNLYPVKGHAVLLQARADLGDLPYGMTIAIAGSGPEEATLAALARQLGIEGSVRLLGYRADVSDLLAAADVFAMPSLSEGLPMAMIEAMLAGKAIVASDAGGIKELLPESTIGIVVPPADSGALAEGLRALGTDPERRRALGVAARARALERFSASAMADAYLDLYAG